MLHAVKNDAQGDEGVGDGLLHSSNTRGMDIIKLKSSDVERMAWWDYTNKRSKQGTITKQATLSKQQLETVLKQRLLKQQLLNQHMLNMKYIHANYGTHSFNAPNACQFKYSSTNNDDW